MSDADRAFAELRRRVLDAGLFHRTPGYYVWRTAISFGILALGVLLGTAEPALSAVLIGFGSVQVALIGHDAGHQAVFNSRRSNNALAQWCWTLAVGVSFAYWNDRHTRHHTRTNDPGNDPDARWEFGPALTPLMAFTLRLEGWRYAVSHKSFSELARLSLSALAWSAPLVVFGWPWLATFTLSQVLASFYLAGVVAPNHIGMPTWPAGASPTFLERQLRSSRNVLPHRLTDFVFGGLNYQIEHHLFPSMPRTRFAAARALVKAFCAECGLPYTESGLFDVYRVVLTELPRISRPQRA